MMSPGFAPQNDLSENVAADGTRGACYYSGVTLYMTMKAQAARAQDLADIQNLQEGDR